MYAAFLSYSHRADATLAPILQRALERLGTPWWRRSPIRVFRDDASLPASAALWPSIERGLTASEHLVLLASPDSAASPWVDREVRWWLAHRAHDRLLIVVTAGSIVYDERARDFDWTRTDCLPHALAGVHATEPFWTDLRFATAAEHRTLRHSAFRGAALGLAAAIRGMAKDELERIDLRQHRRAVTLGAGTGAVLVVLGITAAVALRVATSESANARANLLQAESRRLAAEALVSLDGGRGIETATLKAALAWRLAPTDDARRALRHIDDTTSDVARVLGQHTAGARKIAFSRDGQRLATVGDDGVVLQWSLADGRPVGAPLASERQSVDVLRISRDGSHLLLSGALRQGPRTPTLAVFRLADGARLQTGSAWLEALGGRQDDHKAPCVALGPSGRYAAVGRDGTVVVIETSSGSATPFRLPPSLGVAALGFAGEERLNLLVKRIHGGSLQAGRIDVARRSLTLGPSKAIHGAMSCYGFSSMSDDGARAILPGELSPGDNDHLLLWEIDERLVLHPLPMPEPRPRLRELTGHHAPTFDGSGRRIAYGIGGIGSVWDMEARRLVKTLPSIGDGSHGPPLSLSNDGRFVAALDSSTPVVWSLDGVDVARRIEGSRCGTGALEDACIRRLCERITSDLDARRAHAVLGENHAALVAALRASPCPLDGEPPVGSLRLRR